MDLMKLIKGTDIGDCVARLLFTWNADHPDAEKAKETFISAMMLAALANRETENAALVRSAAESFISDIPDGIADDREALSEIILSEKEGREKLIEIFKLLRD